MSATAPSYFFVSLMNGAAWGGSEELWFRTALYLCGKGVKVGCAVYDWPQKAARLQQLRVAGCTVHLLPKKEKKKRFFVSRLLQKAMYKKRLSGAVAALPVTGYHTTIINQGGLEVTTTAFKNFYGSLGRYALVFHNYNERQVLSGRKKAALRQWTQNASANLFAAHQMHTVLQRQTGFVIGNNAVFINPITFPPPVQPLPYPPLVGGTYTLSVFAALDVARKGQDKLVRLMATPLWQQRPVTVNLYGDGADADALQQQINTAGLGSRVLLKGFTTQITTAIGQSHLVLQLTMVDAMPLSVMEAMAAGRAVAVTKIGDMPQWIQQGKTGWVAEPTAKGIAACMEEAWACRGQWEAMGRRAFTHFRQTFPADVEEEFIRLINKPSAQG